MFVKSITSDVDAATAAARQTIDASLLQLHDRFGQRVDGQVQRIAQRFAMIAAAGELAAAYRVLAWRLGSCFDAVWAVFKEWVDARGTLGAQEDVEAVRAVVAYLERHGDSRSRKLRWSAQPGRAPAYAPEGKNGLPDRAGYLLHGGGPPGAETVAPVSEIGLVSFWSTASWSGWRSGLPPHSYPEALRVEHVLRADSIRYAGS